MTITLTDELAKRVMEALDERYSDAKIAAFVAKMGLPDSKIEHAEREAVDARDLRDELAAVKPAAIKSTRVVQEEFEAWAHQCLFDLNADEYGYTATDTHAAWNAWVGSRAAALLTPSPAEPGERTR